MLSKNYSKWQDLQPELSLVIAKRLTSICDFISFRGVCRSWRSAATFDNFDTEFPSLPCLMYLAEKGEGKSILDEKEVKIWDVYTDTHKITNFPPIYCRRPLLSCFGWTLCVPYDSAAVSLRHLLLPINIKLPDMKPWALISKMVLSGSPMKSDCVVMLIWGPKDGLAFCRPGDESWTEIAEGVDPFFDIIYYNRKLYAVHGTMIYECDIHGSNPTKVVQVFAFNEDNSKSYLVESRGKFLIVSQCNEWRDATVLKFRVIEVDLKDGSAEEIDDLGDRSLFLGTNSSICVEIPESESLKVKPGRIYFTYTDTLWLRLGECVYRMWDDEFENLGIFGFPVSDVDLYSWVVLSI